MAATEAELRTQLQNAVALLDNHLANQTVRTNQDTMVQAVESDFASDYVGGAQDFNDAVSASLSVDRSLTAALNGYAHFVNKSFSGIQGAIDVLYDYFAANSITIKERNFTFGTATAGGGNNGGGTLRALNFDHYAQEIENQYAETKLFTCTTDAETGADKHQEVFRVTAASAAANNELNRAGSGTDTTLNARSSVDSILSNPSFSEYSIAGTVATSAPYTLVAGDTLTDWTTADVTLMELTIDTADIYRDAAGDDEPTAIRFNGNNSITQTFDSAGVDFTRLVPIDFVVPMKRESTADGTVTVTWGSKSQAYTVSGFSDGVYSELFPDQDTDLWPRNFVNENATFKVAWSGRATGELVFDEITLVLRDQIDGSWYAIHGDGTKFILEDTFTVANSIPSDSKIQKWLWRRYNRYLPSTAAPTIADPS